MNKMDYMKELNKALSGLNPQEKEMALRFCEEMIADRMESGLTEEAAVNGMESPREAAEKLMAEIRLQPDTTAPTTAQPLTEEWQKMQLTCEPDRLNNIDLQAGNMGIKVIPAKDGQVTLTYFTRIQNVYIAKVEGDTLLLREQKSESRRSLFNLFGSITGPHASVTLAMPTDLMVNLTLHTKNGGLSLTGPQQLMQVEMSSTNGGVAVNQVKCIALSAHTTNGGVAAAQVEAKRSFSFTTTNGGMAARDCLSGGDLIFRTTNGGVAAENLLAHQNLSLSSNNGSIKVAALDAAAIHLHTTNAAISGTVKGPQSAWQIDSHTTNGKNSLPPFQEGEKPLSVHTSNASIRLGFE